jgi:transcriptional regulator with XRE-family HTH domain
MESIDMGQKLKQAIKKSALSRKEIAHKANISEPNLYRLFRAQDIKVKTLMKLAEVLDVPLQLFLEFKESQVVEELRQQLEHERLHTKLLEEYVRFFDQQFGMLIGILKSVEKTSEGASEFLTLITPEEKQKIPLSSFVHTFFKMITSGNKLPQKEEMYVKYTGKFLNIIEVRRSILENIHLYPLEVQEIFAEWIPEQTEDEYIDFENIWKNL